VSQFNFTCKIMEDWKSQRATVNSSNMYKRALMRFSGHSVVVTNTKRPTQIDISRQLPSATTSTAKSWEWKRKNAIPTLRKERNILKQGQRRGVRPLESDSVISYPISPPLETIVFTSGRVNGHFARNKAKRYRILNGGGYRWSIMVKPASLN